MSWARLDDRANEHRKQLMAGAEACWLWACGLMYANRQDARDGFIPEPMLAMLYPFKAPKRLAAKLVEVGLWEAVPGGYAIHGYHDWNPTREQVEAERMKGRERAAASYQRRKPKSDGSSPEDSGCSSAEDETKKRVSSGVEWSGEGSGSGSPEGDTGEPSPPTPEPSDLQARSRRCTDNPHDAVFLEPEAWPEVVAVVESFRGATGQANARTGSFLRDRGIQAVVALFADGYTPAEVTKAIIRAAGSDWWRGGKKGLSSLSLEVVRRALAEDAPSAPRYESADERQRCRNRLLDRAKAGELGLAAKFWERFGKGAERPELADRLERAETITEATLPERMRGPFRSAVTRSPGPAPLGAMLTQGVPNA